LILVMVMFLAAATAIMVSAEDRIHHGLCSSNQSAYDTGSVWQCSHS
jgi:hypothetical protein